MHIGCQDIVLCPGCGEPLPGSSYNLNAYILCRGCKSGLNVEAFPALYGADSSAGMSRNPVSVGEAGCFYHPSNEAVVPCDTCGRFLCSLCDVEMNDRHICPSCFEKGISRESMPDLVARRVRYDYIALHLAIFPVFMWFITVITAPLTLYMCVRYWKRPLSVIPVTRVRFVLAFIIAVMQISLWGTAAVSLLL